MSKLPILLQPRLISSLRRVASALRLLLLLALALGGTTTVVALGSSSVVIAEVYASGSKSGATYNRDYVVLKNTSSSTVSLIGWSLQHYKTTLGWKVLTLSGSIPAGGFYLIRLYYDGGTSTGATVPTPDLTAPSSSDWNLSTSTAEAVAVVSSTDVLSSCGAASIVDLVGYGATPPCAEGGAGIAVSTATQSLHRASSGCRDTDNNVADFALGTPNPRGSTTAPAVCAEPPSIPPAGRPQDQTAETGAKVSLSVTALGSLPMTYQW